MFHLRYEPETEFLLHQVESKVKFLQLRKVIIFVKKLCMELIKLISTQI